MGVQECRLLPAFQLWQDYGEDYGGDELCGYMEKALIEVSAAKNYQFTWAKWDSKGRPVMSEQAKQYQHAKQQAVSELDEINFRFGACTPRQTGEVGACLAQTAFGGYSKSLGAIISREWKNAHYLTATNSWPAQPICAVQWIYGERRVGLESIIPRSEWAMLLTHYGDRMTGIFGAVGATILTGVGVVLGALALFAAPWLVLKIASWILGLYSAARIREYISDAETLRDIEQKIQELRQIVQKKIYIEEQEKQARERSKSLIPLALLGGLVVVGLTG